MRTIFLTIIFACTSLVLRADNADASCSTDPLRERIADMISHETPFTEFDLEGIVSIQFIVDEAHVIHIKGVSGGNTFLIDHVLASLQNKVLQCDCIAPGTLYTMKLQYVQYS
jgi:hypothetical protein